MEPSQVEIRKVRAELSTLSIEELQELKDKIGLKYFKESNDAKPKNSQFKRDNKNRPKEMSSKKTVSRLRHDLSLEKSLSRRDPRFESACGDFDEKIFEANYKFVDKIRDKEQKLLKRQLKTEVDTQNIEKLNYLLQRRKNQIEGKSLKKSRVRDLELAEKYDALKTSKTLHKYMKKKEKKVLRKERLLNKTLK